MKDIITTEIILYMRFVIISLKKKLFKKKINFASHSKYIVYFFMQFVQFSIETAYSTFYSHFINI